MVAKHREVVGERMPAAAIGQDAGHAGDHRRDQDDEPDNGNHDVLPGSGLLTGSWQAVAPAARRSRVTRNRRGWAWPARPSRLPSTVLAVLSGARTGGSGWTGGNRRTGR